MNAAIGSLLSWLHSHFGAASCPGDWVWTITAFGVLVGIVGAACAVLIAVSRRTLGARDSRPMVVGAALLSVVGGFALPWWLLVGITGAVPAAALRASHSPLAPAGGGAGLSDAALAGFATGYCHLPRQGLYLASARSVLGALSDPAAGLTVFIGRFATLVAMPILIGLCLWWLGRVVFRTGPAWQRWLFLGSFAALVLATTSRAANVTGLVWCGVLPVAALVLPICRLIAGPKIHPAAPDATTQVVLPGPGQLSPGQVAGGRFQPLRELGRGGFGAVWLCTDTSLDRKVAVKLAHIVQGENRERMRREARALAAIRHPNCVRVYDLVDSDDSGLAIVMEYITGRSLTDVIRADGPVDDTTAGRFWADTASALLATHQVGVLHRDIKPANVLLAADGSPCLIDFGIARTSGDITVTATGAVIGTPSYLAPEVAAGGPATPESDVWQLAATVNYALTGQPPRGMHDDDRQAWAAAIRGAACSAIASESAHSVLLSEALDNDPGKRPTLPELITSLGGSTQSDS